ncbi:MAG: hypothetical protein K6V97_08400, partial [Actinomycetia bacterium]|nr:hypothetical protein [Actinomycetes bacterium]
MSGGDWLKGVESLTGGGQDCGVLLVQLVVLRLEICDLSLSSGGLLLGGLDLAVNAGLNLIHLRRSKLTHLRTPPARW